MHLDEEMAAKYAVQRAVKFALQGRGNETMTLSGRRLPPN
jgi:hypothetical protein